MDKHICFIIMNLKVMKTGCHRNRCISTRVLSVEPDAARFSDGQEKPIEAVAKGEGRARVDIDKLNARTFDPTASGEQRKWMEMVNLGKKIWPIL